MVLDFKLKVCGTTLLKQLFSMDQELEKLHLFPRIPMIPSDSPFDYKRLQFPVKVSFAITINKGQGQTIIYVGLNLREDCFSHGQLYVGVTRTGNPDNQIVLIPQGNKTKNIVYTEVL